MGTLTLDELKADNAKERQEANKEPVKDEYIEVDSETEKPIEKEVDLAEDVEDTVDTDGSIDTDDVEDTDDTDDSKDDALEDWQKSEEDEVSKDSKKKGFVPNAGAANLRRKIRDVKKEKNSEIDELKAEIEQLKVSSKPSPQEQALPPRPKMEDPSIDYDQDKYDQALDEWQDEKVDRKMSTHTDTLQQQRLKEAQLQARVQKTETAVTGQLERAATLIGEGKITEDKWLAGDMKIRLALEAHVPGAGDALADQFITLLSNNGAEGEKVWYHIGNNDKTFNEFIDKVVGDSTGASAVMHLAGIQNKFSQTANKKRSDAPKPATKLKGDKASGSGGKAKKQYDAAMGDPQTRFDLKRAAKAKGVDVSKW